MTTAAAHARSGVGRVFEHRFLQYRHSYRATLFSSFLTPVLFLAAMGVGLGSYVDGSSNQGLDGLSYLAFLAPGLLAATCMQSAAFELKVLAPSLPEAPFDLRFFSGAVKTDSRGVIITGPDDDPVKKLVGAEAAGQRAGVDRFTKILFGVGYFDGRPDPGTRIDPNNPQVNSGSQHWPFVKQPFRSWPNSLALTPDGQKLYITLPGREGYPDWRVASVDTGARRVVRWIDLRVPDDGRYVYDW